MAAAAKSLSGRVALVTGSGRGIGRTVARLLARRGATVIVNSFHSREQGEQTAAEIDAEDGRAVHLWGSVANPDHVDEMFGQIEKQFGLDILVCNASDGRIGPFLDLTPQDWDRAFRTNVSGHHQCAVRAAELMRPRGGGSIVTMSAVGAHHFVDGLGCQGVVKAAVESLTRYLACALGPSGIRVNCVAGGPVYGDLLAKFPEARRFPEPLGIDDTGRGTVYPHGFGSDDCLSRQRRSTRNKRGRLDGGPRIFGDGRGTTATSRFADFDLVTLLPWSIDGDYECMYYYATAYTIHFDDTMAYGSHHFLTSFKFQCFSRESFLFGEHIFDVAGVREALNGIHLLTADAYARNFNPAILGDRVAILLTIEDWQRASNRFCYRVIGRQGTPICAGFQSLICADARTGRPLPLPTPLWNAMEEIRGIEEPLASESFRERVLAGGSKVESLFGDVERNTAIHYLAERYPSPKLIPATQPVAVTASGSAEGLRGAGSPEPPPLEAWVFAGQGAFDAALLSQRVAAYQRSAPSARGELEQCAAIAQELVGGDASAIVGGRSAACAAAVEATPGLSQFAIHLQNVLGASLRQSRGNPPGILMGHSFGEIAAFGVAGCFDLPTGVRIVCQRVRAIAEHAPPGGGLLAVMADRATVVTEAALSGLEEVLVAGRNHEGQTVVSGPRDNLERLRDCLQRINVKSVAIPTPTSFHHPRLRSSALAWLETLKTLPLKGPSGSLYSPIGRRFISPHEDIATLLASQLVRPFDFEGGIFDVTEAGATKFVDCGSTGSLARIIAKAGAEGLDVSCIGMTDDGASKAKRSPGRSDAADLGSPRDRGQEQEREPNTVSVEQRSGERRVPPPVAIVGQGCMLPGSALSPGQLFTAITEQRNGIVDQRQLDPHWEEDFYSAKLVPDRSTSCLGGAIEDREIVAPAGIDQGIFKRFSRAQRLLCIALAPCVTSLKDAERVMCIIGATADGFEDQDAASSLRLAGIDPTSHDVQERMNTTRSAFQEPYDAVREVFDRIVRPGLEITLVDAACASSLYSVALGVHALEANKAGRRDCRRGLLSGAGHGLSVFPVSGRECDRLPAL